MDLQRGKYMANVNALQPMDKDVQTYLNGIENKGRREDAFQLLPLMEDASGEEGECWSGKSVGFGNYHYV
jgi:hypothetical protein